MTVDSDNTESINQASLEYHAADPPGKLGIHATKSLSNQRDLALAYTPGVGKVCEVIAKDAVTSFKYTNRGNLVAVISNGTAVLGLGNIGALASKPVMEGKAVLFKKFAGIDVFDLEINEKDPQKLVDIITALEPTFGGINLEDIKSPECFLVERKLRKSCSIPVFHDDQHGTAIVVSAAIINALLLTGRELTSTRIVTSGAGAAALACLELLTYMGLPKENIIITDRKGVLYSGRKTPFNEIANQFLWQTDVRTLNQALKGADLFLGLSAAGVLNGEALRSMNAQPIIMALANPVPEIMPDEAQAVRPDALIATGRSDYPNQVNNVLCFPYIFRGALDCGATQITRKMEVAVVQALAKLAREEIPESVAKAYNLTNMIFGKNYFIVKPFDDRLLSRIAPAVAVAAQESNVATRPILDLKTYRDQLIQFTTYSASFMKPIFSMAKSAKKKRIILCEGEEENILRASQILVDEDLAHPILIARPQVLQKRIERYGLRLKVGENIDVVNPENDERYYEYWNSYFKIAQRRGINHLQARYQMRHQLTLIGSMLLRKNEGDAMICGIEGTLVQDHLRYIDLVIGKNETANCYASLNALILSDRQVFLVDTDVNYDPSPEELTEITVTAAEQIKMFGIVPYVALLSHANFGSSDFPSAIKMRRVYKLLKEKHPDLYVEGEMQGDLAIHAHLHSQYILESAFEQAANLLVFPNLDAANISCNLLKATAGNNITVGNVLLGVKYPVAIVKQAATVRRVVNLAAFVIAQANSTE